MIFSSPIFVFFFLPFTLGTYYVVRSIRWRNAVLLLSSAFFYVWGEGSFIAVLLALAFVNYGFGLAIATAQERENEHLGRRLVAVAIAIDLLPLLYFKYAGFAFTNVGAILALAGSWSFSAPTIYLPLAVSFYTFHAISYIVDVHRRTANVQRDPWKVVLYLAFFPQLIAGPIIRYQDVAAQLSERRATKADFLDGIRRFVNGLGKKVLVADVLGYQVDRIFSLSPERLTLEVAWFGIIAFTIQLYFDFSGYSDIAIGLAKMFGFRFLENFNYPLISQSITEFWRRWHISLTNWFRDYVYIPLGGNRSGRMRTYLNLLIVFFLCGLWHGARWTFIIWGLDQGFFMMLERSGVIAWPSSRRWATVRHAYFIVVVLLGFVIFRSPTITYAGSYFQALFGIHAAPAGADGLGEFATGEADLALLIAVFFTTPAASRVRRALAAASQVSERGRVVCLACSSAVSAAIFSLATVKLETATYTPFIYFRF